jgi:AraC-like DNA-binding protein
MKERPHPIRAATIDTVGQSPAQARVLQRHVSVGPVVVSDITFQADMVVECDDVGAGYYVHLPISGRLESRHGGSKLTATRELAAVYQPGGGAFSGQWPAGSRALCVRLDEAAVDTALARLPGQEPAPKTRFELAMNTRQGLGRTWVEQLLVLCRQPAGRDGLLAHPLVSRPLAESLVNGFLLAAGHSRSTAVAALAAAAVEPAPPATIRKAIDLIEADPRAPLSVADLATGCGVGARALQHGFQRHVGLSPMGYLRDARLRGADADLRAAAAADDTVASIARRWGFAHPGRFAAAYEAKYGQPPGRTLRGARDSVRGYRDFSFRTITDQLPTG